MTYTGTIDFTKPRREYPGATAGISHSLLKHMHESPARFYHEWHSTEWKDTPDMLAGRVTHTMTWEREKFIKRYYIFNLDLRPQRDKNPKTGKPWTMTTKRNAAWKEHIEKWCKAMGREIIDFDTFKKASTVNKVIQADQKIQSILKGGKSEVWANWIDEETGLPCKGKADHVTDTAVIDLKGCQDPARFEREIKTMHMDQQMAMYCDAFNLDKCYWLAYDKSKNSIGQVIPYDGTHWLDLGRLKYRWALRQVRHYNRLGKWPLRHDDEIKELFPAKWDVERYETKYI